MTFRTSKEGGEKAIEPELMQNSTSKQLRPDM